MITGIYIPQTLDDARAGRLAGENPDYGIEKLFNDIENGNYPTWTVYIVSKHVIRSNERMTTTCQNFSKR